MLIPIMGNAQNTEGDGEEMERVLGVIMVASTERAYTAGPLFTSISEHVCIIIS